MAIRISSKALILKDQMVLLGHGAWYHGDDYDLPGGGQHIYETMKEALVRQVLEETGYMVIPGRLAAVKEEIFTDLRLREKWPEYTHRVNHVFLCELADVPRQKPTEMDQGSEGVFWYPVEKLPEIADKLFPRGLVDALPRILAGECVVLDTQYLEDSLEWMEEQK